MSVTQATTDILAFPRRPTDRYRLSGVDKEEACRWEQDAFGLGYDRIAISQGSVGSMQENSDFVLVYRMGDSWARWGCARQGTSVLLWRCGNGVLIGLFPSMGEALAAVPPASPAPPGRRREAAKLKAKP